jgi:GAF domain-containing protein
MFPIRGRSEVLGTLAFARLKNNPYDPDELDFLSQMSKQMAFPVEHVLLYDENLGMNRSTLRFRMNKLGIIKPWKLGIEF